MAGDDGVDLADGASAELAAPARPWSSVRGRPRLNGDLLAADLVDELCLTARAPAGRRHLGAHRAVGPDAAPPRGGCELDARLLEGDGAAARAAAVRDRIRRARLSCRGRFGLGALGQQRELALEVGEVVEPW